MSADPTKDQPNMRNSDDEVEGHIRNTDEGQPNYRNTDEGQPNALRNTDDDDTEGHRFIKL